MTLSSATLILAMSNLEKVSLVSVWSSAVVEKTKSNRLCFLRQKFKPNWCRTTLFICKITVFLRCVVISEFCRITDTPVFSGPAERRLSLASTTSAVLSVSLSQQRSQPEALEAAAAALSYAQQSPSWARGEFPAIMSEQRQKRRNLRESAANGVWRRDSPLLIHLAIESGITHR